ncbi:hypothetical protein N3940_18925, partial [Acinetobacter baumannii]
MMNKQIIVEKLRNQLDGYYQIDKLFFLNAYQMGQIQNIQFVSQLNILLSQTQAYTISYNCYEILKEHLPLSFLDAYFDYSLIENTTVNEKLDLDTLFDFTNSSDQLEAVEA